MIKWGARGPRSRADPDQVPLDGRANALSRIAPPGTSVEANVVSPPFWRKTSKRKGARCESNRAWYVHRTEHGRFGALLGGDLISRFPQR
jgi:hypothetical protein